MELFERILSLEAILGSKSRIAKVLGITPQRLNAYSNETSQRNFLHLLPRLLKAIPDLSRDWLYFDEGPQFVSKEQATQKALPAPVDVEVTPVEQSCSMEDQLLRQIDRLTETNRQLTETNRQLTDINRKLIEELMRRTTD